MVLSCPQAHPLQQHSGPLETLCLWYPGISHGQLHIFKSRCPGNQVKGLEHKPYLPVPDIGQLIRCHLRHIHAIQVIMSQRRAVQAPQNIHKGGFSRTGMPHNGHKLAPVYGEVDLLKSQNLDGSGIIYLYQVFQLEQGTVPGLLVRGMKGKEQPPEPGRVYVRRQAESDFFICISLGKSLLKALFYFVYFHWTPPATAGARSHPRHPPSWDWDSG